MLADVMSRVKEWGSEYKTDALLGVAVFSVAIMGFGFGRLSITWQDKAPIRIEEPATTKSATAAVSEPVVGESPKASGYIASKNGSAYYPHDCAAGNRIKPENIIKFETAEAAERAGYRPAANCR